MTLVLPALMFVIAMLACAGLIAALIPRLQRAAIIDVPNDRSLHLAPVPRGAGFAIAVVVLGLQLALVLSGQWPGQAALVTMLVAGGFAALGWADDRASRGVLLRFGIQAGLSALFVLSVLPAELGWLPRALLCVAVMWAVNLFNFMDGADGFAGVQALLASLGLAVLLAGAGQGGAALAACAVAGAAAGFLRWNWHPARIFLGDVGSYFIGFELAALVLSCAGSARAAPALILVAPFVVDASLTLLARAMRGVPVWRAHREHVYQRLVLRGWSPARLSTALLLILIGLCWPAAALSVTHGMLPALFVYGLLAIIWLWVRRVTPLPRS